MASVAHGFTQDEYDAAAARIRVLAAHINAAHAELTQLAAHFDERRLWAGDGIRTCRHWLTINTGVSEHSADELLRVGHALEELPLLRAAFESGQLSLDKVRMVTRVATAAEEDLWLQMAQYASGAQLARIVRGYESCNDTRLPERQRSERGLWARWRSDGMLELRALLSSEDGAVVLAALDAVARRTGTPDRTPTEILQAGGSMEEAANAALDPAPCPIPARRADALAMVCEAVAGGAGGELMRTAPAHRLVVHVDIGVLTGEQPDGRCQVEGGPGLSAVVAQRLGCDAEIVTITERDGKPVDVGRSQRRPSPRQIMAVKARDAGCRFPGCPVPARYADVHHVLWRSRGGDHDVDNLLTLCRFHHTRHHDGVFDIELAEDLRPVFRNPGGTPIGEPSGPPLVPLTRLQLRRLLRGRADGIDEETPVALDRGARFDLDLTVEALHFRRSHSEQLATQGASP